MKCEAEYCIYNRDFVCILNGTNIDSVGMCTECSMVSIDRAFLKAEKERQLQELEKDWAQGQEGWRQG